MAGASLTGATGGLVLGQLAKDRISTAAPDAWLYVMGALFALVALVMPHEQYPDFAWSFADRDYVIHKGRVVETGQTADTPTHAVQRYLSV